MDQLASCEATGEDYDQTVRRVIAKMVAAEAVRAVLQRSFKVNRSVGKADYYLKGNEAEKVTLDVDFGDYRFCAVVRGASDPEVHTVYGTCWQPREVSLTGKYVIEGFPDQSLDDCSFSVRNRLSLQGVVFGWEVV
ncbi:MAG: hypothetical protein V1895_03080 [Parcubacteria group bacterium]